MKNIKLKFKLLTTTAQLPRYAYEGDSGMDICADEPFEIAPHSRATVTTGIAAIIPNGYELQVRPRSGMSKNGLVASFGTVDEGYRGEIRVTVFNHTEFVQYIDCGNRIAQLVLAPVTRADIEETDYLGKNTERGTNGFGSTGV